MKHPGTLNFRWERSNLQERTRQAQFAHILKKGLALGFNGW